MEKFWKCYYLAYGGCLVRKHFNEEPEAQELVFDVFYLSQIMEEITTLTLLFSAAST